MLPVCESDVRRSQANPDGEGSPRIPNPNLPGGAAQAATGTDTAQQRAAQKAAADTADTKVRKLPTAIDVDPHHNMMLPGMPENQLPPCISSSVYILTATHHYLHNHLHTLIATIVLAVSSFSFSFLCLTRHIILRAGLRPVHEPDGQGHRPLLGETRRIIQAHCERAGWRYVRDVDISR